MEALPMKVPPMEAPVTGTATTATSFTMDMRRLCTGIISGIRDIAALDTATLKAHAMAHRRALSAYFTAVDEEQRRVNTSGKDTVGLGDHDNSVVVDVWLRLAAAAYRLRTVGGHHDAANALEVAVQALRMRLCDGRAMRLVGTSTNGDDHADALCCHSPFEDGEEDEDGLVAPMQEPLAIIRLLLELSLSFSPSSKRAGIDERAACARIMATSDNGMHEYPLDPVYTDSALFQHELVGERPFDIVYPDEVFSTVPAVFRRRDSGSSAASVSAFEETPSLAFSTGTFREMLFPERRRHTVQDKQSNDDEEEETARALVKRMQSFELWEKMGEDGNERDSHITYSWDCARDVYVRGGAIPASAGPLKLATETLALRRGESTEASSLVSPFITEAPSAVYEHAYQRLGS